MVLNLNIKLIKFAHLLESNVSHAELTLKYTLAVGLSLVNSRLAIRRAFLWEASVGAERDGFLHADTLLLPTRRQRLNASRLL